MSRQLREDSRRLATESAIARNALEQQRIRLSAVRAKVRSRRALEPA
jgi:hypothetical protein